MPNSQTDGEDLGDRRVSAPGENQELVMFLLAAFKFSGTRQATVSCLLSMRVGTCFPCSEMAASKASCSPFLGAVYAPSCHERLPIMH